MRIVAIGGSWPERSGNLILLQTAVETGPGGAEVVVFDEGSGS